MKPFYHIAALFLVVLLAAPFQQAQAQVPSRLAYQGVVLDQAGAPLADGQYQVTFRLYADEDGGQALWTETQTVAVDEGLLSTLIGAERALDLPFDKPYFLTVELDGQPESERMALSSAAYALVARDVTDGSVVRSISGLKDAVEIVGEGGITVRQEGNRLVISGAAVPPKGYGVIDGDVSPRSGTPMTEEEDEAALEALAAVAGPGGSNTGLDAAYDTGRQILLDDGRILLTGAGLGVGFEVRNASMLFRDQVGGSPSFIYKVDGVSTEQVWENRLNAVTGALITKNITSNRTPFQMTKSAANNLVKLDGSKLTINDASGTPKITLDANVSGDGRVITQELEITGGSDLSEMFDVAAAEGLAPAPGMVVSIDPETPGHLRVSDAAYDRMVAGVVSGAGGIQTGLLMGQRGSEADGELPIALTGRVYVWVDASYGAITPGDLLTTSETPGHAMKVGDYNRSQGAILGKAMTALPEGQGLVLMLVTLQ